MELLCYLATMFNTQHSPSEVMSCITARLCEVFVEHFDDTYSHEAAPTSDRFTHLRLSINREDGEVMTARDFMDFHHFLSAVCYTDPILKDLIEFDDFYFAVNKPLHIVSLEFYVL